MTALEDHQFEILPSEDAADGFVFGIGAEVSVDDGGFDPGSAEWLVQDQDNSRRGVRAFGRDVTSGSTWTWESHVNRSTEDEAAETLDRFTAAWRPEALSLTPGAVTALRYRVGGRDRRVFGRPRRLAGPPSNLILSGYVQVTHEFECVDSMTYDDVESNAQILYSSSAEGGGIILPAQLPAASLPSVGTGVGQLTVLGRARAYPRIRFHGPWTNPVFDTGDWSLTWTGTIGEGRWVEIDCRPWALSVLDESGASRVRGLDRRTYLEDCWFAPQSQPQVSLGGIATSGSASVTVSWRNTWTSF